MSKNQDPEAAETVQTESIKAVDPAAICSPLAVAIRGYMKNRLSLVESLGEVSFAYWENGLTKAGVISKEIERIDVILADLASQENVKAMATTLARAAEETGGDA